MPIIINIDDFQELLVQIWPVINLYFVSHVEEKIPWYCFRRIWRPAYKAFRVGALDWSG